MSKDNQAAIDAAMENYRIAVDQHRVATFDVTAIEGLGVRMGVNENNREGTLLTFKHLKAMPESQRNALLNYISSGYGVNFGMPEGVTWEAGTPDSRAIFDANLMD